MSKKGGRIKKGECLHVVGEWEELCCSGRGGMGKGRR